MLHIDYVFLNAFRCSRTFWKLNLFDRFNVNLENFVNLKIKNLIFICLFSSCYANAQPAIQPFDMEVTTLMLQWKKGESINKNIASSSAIKKWTSEFSVENFYYTELDVDGDQKNEVLVADAAFPARGRGVLAVKRY